MNYKVFTVEELNKDGEAVSSSFPSSLYMASKESGISLGALRSARDKGNTLLTRRKDKKKFRVFWGTSHNICFQARREREKEKEREKDLEEWRGKVRRRPSFQKLLEEAKEATGSGTGLQSDSEPWLRN